MTDEITNRANEIIRKEPVTTKTLEVLASFDLSLNSRTPVESDKINATHGANFATIIQALRNANGQIVPTPRLIELSIEQRTGEGAPSNGSPTQSPPFVSVGLIRAGLSIAHHYALIEAGHGHHYWGKPTRSLLSEASNIPIIAIGELIDPDSKGRACHEEYYLKVENLTWVDNIPEDNPMHGWTYEQVSQALDFIHNLGERLNIRLLLVWDPESKGRNEMYRDLVKEVIELIAEEQKLDYSDISVIMVKERTEDLTSQLTEEDIKNFFLNHENQSLRYRFRRLWKARLIIPMPR